MAWLSKICFEQDKCIINVMIVDELAMQGVGSSATTVLAYVNTRENIS